MPDQDGTLSTVVSNYISFKSGSSDCQEQRRGRTKSTEGVDGTGSANVARASSVRKRYPSTLPNITASNLYVLKKDPTSLLKL